MFGFMSRRAEQDMALGQEIEDHYTKDLASWQIERGLNRMDLSPDQDRRFRLHNRVENVGMDAGRVAFAQWLVQQGRCSDD